MQRLKVLGLALVAALAMSAVTVANASAALPEFKLEAGHGFPIKIKSKNKAGVEPTLKSAFGTTVKCTTSADSGELTGAKTVAKVRVNYTGCKENAGNKCTTGAKVAGEIETSLIKGRVDYLVGRVTNESGMELEPEAGTLFAEFKCGIVTVKVEGCTIGEAKPLNMFSLTGELLWEENAAKNGQKWTEIVNGVHKPCTLKAFGGNAWLADNEVEEFLEGATPVKVKLEA